MSLIADIVRTDFEFSTDPPVVKWLEENIVLPSLMAPASPGPFSTERRPYMRPILDCGHPQSGVRSLTVTGGSQSGKTTALALIACYRIPHAPGPTLILGNSEDWLRVEISDKRMDALISNNQVLRVHKPYNADNYRKLAMQMSGGYIVFEGINSDTSTSGSTQRIVWICEAAKIIHHEKDQAPEAHPIKLAFERTKEFRGLELQMMDFTPNTPNHLAWLTYQRGTQTHFHVPCPHCGHHFPFEFEVRKNGELLPDDEMEQTLEEEQERANSEHYRSLIWSPDARRADGSWDINRVRETVRYICPKNGCQIHDDHKPAMISKFEAVNHNTRALDSDRSYRIPSFYAPKVSFGDMAKEFLDKGDLISTGLQNFYNSWLALPWSIYAFKLSDKHVSKCISGTEGTGTEAYARGIIPSKPLHLGLYCDPGEKATDWAVWALMPNGDLMAIQWGKLASEKDLIAPEFLRTLRFPLAGTHEFLHPISGICDAGWNTEEIYDICQASRGFLHPSKGDPTSRGTWNVTRAASRSRDELELYTYSDTGLKDEQYGRRIQRRRGPRIIFPVDADMMLLTGFTNQTKDRQTGRWKEILNDHQGDCCKLALLHSMIMRATGLVRF